MLICLQFGRIRMNVKLQTNVNHTAMDRPIMCGHRCHWWADGGVFAWRWVLSEDGNYLHQWHHDLLASKRTINSDTAVVRSFKCKCILQSIQRVRPTNGIKYRTTCKVIVGQITTCLGRISIVQGQLVRPLYEYNSIVWHGHLETKSANLQG